MKIDVRHEDAATFIVPNGEIDMAKAPLLRQTFIRVTEAKKTPIVVNFAEVGYIDSAGIATLVECLRFVREYGGELRLCGASEMVFDVFEIANLDSVFAFYADEATAVAD